MSGAHERLGLLSSLRATRAFTAHPVAEEAVARMLEVGRWTGSARNRQPWRVVVVRDAALKGGLSRLGAYAQVLAGAPLVLALAVDADAGGADAEFDAGRLAQSLMLAGHAQGLGSCPATLFPAGNARRAAALCGLGAPWRVRTALAIGHPAPVTPPGGRRAIPSGRMTAQELRIDHP